MSETKPINPRKAWTVVALITLGALTVFGGFILSNMITVIMFAIPAAIAYFGSHSKIANIAWITGGVVVVELLALAIGVFEPLQRRLSNFGGEVQCLSAFVLIIWAVVTFRKKLAAKAGIPAGTEEAVKEALKQGAKQASDWLHK